MKYTLSLQGGLKMKSNTLDSIIGTILMLVILFVTYQIGYGVSERAHCIANKGHYSLDYGECIKGDLSER
jgi:hypothetical protein